MSADTPLYGYFLAVYQSGMDTGFELGFRDGRQQVMDLLERRLTAFPLCTFTGADLMDALGERERRERLGQVIDQARERWWLREEQRLLRLEEARDHWRRRQALRLRSTRLKKRRAA